MEYLNRIELRGSVGSVKCQVVGDKQMARLTLVTNYAYKDRNGAPVIETTWHNIVAWESRLVSNLESIEKGSRIYVEGRLRSQKYTGSDGVERASVEVVATRLFLFSESETMSPQCP